MARSVEEYKDLLKSLLPRGKFWEGSENRDLIKLLRGLSASLSRIEGRSEDLIKECFYSSINELISEEEEELGIPEEGFSLPDTIEERRSLIQAKKLAVGQQDKGYFIEIASALGWTITVTEYPKFLAGLSSFGDAPASSEDALFYMMINIWVEDLNNADIHQLMFEINLRSPGHAEVLYRFYNIGFSSGFSNGFSSVPFWDGKWYPLAFDRGFGLGFANSCDYIGSFLTGGYDKGFSEAFHRLSAGGFEFDGFSSGFAIPG